MKDNNDAVYGHCEECRQKVESDKLIVIADVLIGDRFYCNRCRPKTIGNIYPSGFDKSNFWLIADLLGYIADKYGNYVEVDREQEEQTKLFTKQVLPKRKDAPVIDVALKKRKYKT